MNLIFFLCLGFVLCVVWIDLKFDWLAVPYRGKPGPLPEEVLAPMSYFYRYITVNPIALALAMLFSVVTLIMQIIQASVPAWVSWTSLILFALAFVRAFLLVIPVARSLGKRTDSLEKQTSMAHALLIAHLFGFSLVLAVTLLQLYALWGK